MKKGIVVCLVMLLIFCVGLITGTTKTEAVDSFAEVDVIEDGNVQKKIADINNNQKTVDKINALNIEIEDLENAQDDEITPLPTESGVPEKIAYLTFDDGPSKNTIKILDFLRDNNICATFFVLGKVGQDEVYQRIVNEGHTLALHSNTHEYSDIYKTTDTFLEDIEKLKELIQNVTGYTPDILRFPGGSNNTVSHRYGGVDIMEEIIIAVEESGYVYFDWNVDSLDASKGVQDEQVIINAVINQSSVLDQAVILMHDSRYKTTTVDALPEIVEGLKNLGFKFDKLTSDSPIVQF